jgi:hypothetical protein
MKKYKWYIIIIIAVGAIWYIFFRKPAGKTLGGVNLKGRQNTTTDIIFPDSSYPGKNLDTTSDILFPPLSNNAANNLINGTIF